MTTADAGVCLGLLLKYSNGSTESLGKIRFDRYVSEEMISEECVFSNQMIERKLHAEFWTSSDEATQCLDEGFKLPAKGKVVWWSGPNGSQMGILE